MCQRCQVANIECAGYQQKRHVEPRKSRQARVDSSVQQPSLGFISSSLYDAFPSPAATAASVSTSHAAFLLPRTCGNGLPLIALPNNPRPGQRPGPGARYVLGYHQFLFRTLPLLFPQEHLYFWRDQLCEGAWGSEYIFLTLTALGSLHRAVLMASVPQEIDQKSGLDIKITAVQIYTQALQELSNDLDRAKKTPKMLVAVLSLMAYFEVSSATVISQTGTTNVASVIQWQYSCLYGPC
jgi:hypothetical protein